MSLLDRYSSQTRAKLAALYAGLVFGLYWIPLRKLENAGLTDVLPAMMFNLVPMTLILPLIIWRWQSLRRAPIGFHVTGLFLGLSIVAYTNAFLYTDVVRVLILYYLTPIWGFILARIFIGDLITPIRWIAILLGIVGMLSIFGVDAGIPLPSNVGDWAALAGGVLWAVGCLRMLMSQQSPIDYGILFFLWNGIVSVAVTLWFFSQTGTVLPPAEAFYRVLPWFVPLAILLVIPGGFAVMYGPTQLNPGIVGLFFMIEIGVGVVTASILTDEPFGWREFIGVLMITLAALIEPLRDLIRYRKQNHA